MKSCPQALIQELKKRIDSLADLVEAQREVIRKQGQELLKRKEKERD